MGVQKLTGLLGGLAAMKKLGAPVVDDLPAEMPAEPGLPVSPNRHVKQVLFTQTNSPHWELDVDMCIGDVDHYVLSAPCIKDTS